MDHSEVEDRLMDILARSLLLPGNNGRRLPEKSILHPIVSREVGGPVLGWHGH